MPAADGVVDGDDVVRAAMQYLGVKYVWGGTDPATGLDCSGFTQRAYGDVGLQIPRVSSAQARGGTAVATLDQAKPGDIVAFGAPVHHVGIYLGGGMMIDAPHTGDKVRIRKATSVGRPTAIRRYLAPGDDLTFAGTAPADLTTPEDADDVAGDGAPSTLDMLTDTHTYYRAALVFGGFVLLVSGLLLATGAVPGMPGKRKSSDGLAALQPEHGETPDVGPREADVTDGGMKAVPAA